MDLASSSHAARLPRKSHAHGRNAAAQNGHVLTSSSSSASLARSPSSSAPYSMRPRQQQNQSSASLRSTSSHSHDRPSSDMSESSCSEDKDCVSLTQHTSSRKPRQSLTMIRWTQAEDKTLIIALKGNGRQWKHVSAALRRAGGPHRDERAAQNRYYILKTEAERQRDRKAAAKSTSASASVSTSSSSRQQISAAALLAASSSIHNRNVGQLSSAWTRRELNKLEAIAPSAASLPEVFEAFCRAFPSTTRTKQAVMTKWRRMRNGRADRGKGERWERSEGGDEDQDEEEESANEEEPAAWSGMTLSKGASTARGAYDTSPPTNQHQAKPVDTRKQPSQSFYGGIPAASSHNDANATPHLPTFKPTPRFSRLNVTINYQHDGFQISNLPMGYGIVINSPTQCQVLSPDQLASYTAARHQHEKDVEPELAPFVFQAESGGGIHALVLPLGSTMSISVIGEEERHGGQEVERSQRTSTVVESRFEGPDGYLLVFRQCVE